MKNQIVPILLGAVSSTFICSSPTAVAGPWYFQGLGDLPGGNFESLALDLSADGSVAVGYSYSASAEREAFRWTKPTGMRSLGDLPGGGFYSSAIGISRNGRFIVGSSASDRGDEAFRWQDLNGNGASDPGEMIGLGLLPGHSASVGLAATNDGAVVGAVDTPGVGPGTEAFVWQDGNGNNQSDPGEMQVLPDLPGGGVYNNAYGFSGDELTIAGHADGGTSPFEASRWVKGVGGDYQAIGLGEVGVGYAASYDGSVIVGYMVTSEGQQGFRWTQASGMVGIGDFAGGPVESHLDDVTDDGSVAVGVGRSASGYEALIYDQTNGIRRLEDVLTAYGVDLSGWTLQGASGITPDGLTIIGWGINPSGYRKAWIAQIPAPGAVLLGTIGLSFSSWLLRRRGLVDS